MSSTNNKQSHSSNRVALRTVSTLPPKVRRSTTYFLNQLTVQNFSTISQKLLELVQLDGEARIIRQVANLIVDTAINVDGSEAGRECAMLFARLSRFLVVRIRMFVCEVEYGMSCTTGSQLFRKTLLDHCQREAEVHFEGHFNYSPSPGEITASKEGDYQESPLDLDGAFSAEKYTRRRLAFVRFFGELFLVGSMLTERPAHEWIHKDLAELKSPRNEIVAHLCEFIALIGKMLDVPKAKAHLDIYFTRMKYLFENERLSSRVRFMLLVSLHNFVLLQDESLTLSLAYHF